MKATAPHTTLLSFIAQEFNEGILWGRLRGIDTPEMNTAAGRKAKAFVVKVLKGLDHIIISSSKSDKYDRYLADVFVSTNKPSNQRETNNAPRPQGAGVSTEKYMYLNQELLDKDLAILWKE